MKYRILGRTGFKVSEVGFGAWAIGGNKFGNSYGPTNDEVSLTAVRRALELGCNFFDTADVYGHGDSEELLGRALKDAREDVIIATKVGGDFYSGRVKMNFNADYIAFALQRSLQRLQTDYVDLYQLHNPPLDLIMMPQTYDILEDLKRKGEILSYGVSIHEPLEGLMAIETGRPDVLQLPFNVFRQEWKEELFPAARKSNVGIIAREPLCNGFLTGKYDEDSRFPTGDIRHYWPRDLIRAYAQASRILRSKMGEGSKSLAQISLQFVLSNEEVSVTIAGAKTPEHVEENLAASDGTYLSSEQVKKIEELYQHNFFVEGW